MPTKFKPLLVSFNEKEYEAEQEKAHKKLNLLDSASVWINNTIPLDRTINLKRLHLNMTECFKDIVANVYKDVNTLELTPIKLIEAKEINLNELRNIQSEYDAIQLEVSFKDNTPEIKVSKKDFQIWTRNEEQNAKLNAGLNLIEALKGVEKHAKIFGLDITRGTSMFVNYNVRKNEFEVSQQYIFQ